MKKRSSASGRRARRPEPVVFEPLEPRVLLSATCPNITDVFADNRGFVTILLDQALISSTVNNTSVRMFTAGADGLLGTADDVAVNKSVRFEDSNNSIRIESTLAPDTRYRLVLDASIIQGQNGMFLDGEFNGAGETSGNGVQGGNFEIFTRRAVTPIARFSTIAGILDVELFDNQTPLTVANFLAYANAADWDGTFFHRLVENFVIQGGGFETANLFPPIPQMPAVQNEPGISNLFGTIAMAKLSSGPNTATNQWFFNLGNNSGNLDNQNGGFTVFGEITGSYSLATLQALASFDTFDASAQNGAFNELPVVDVEAVMDNNDVPTTDDVITVSRIAILMDISGEAFQQLDPDNAITYTNNQGNVTVRVFALDGMPAAAFEPFFRVQFGENRSVQRVTMLEGMPDRPFGIQIEGSTVLNALADQRRNQTGDLAFIVSDARIESINLRGGITGYNLNGFVLPGGLEFDPDIDGDNIVSDLTAVFVPVGNSNALTVGGDMSGDALFLGGLNRVTVRGETRGTDLRIGAGNLNRLVANFRQVIDTRVVSDAPIASVRATDWSVVDTLRGLIEATSLQKLRITGDQSAGLDGNFSADLDLSGDDMPRALANATIAGGVLAATWEIVGDVGKIVTRDPSSAWGMTINGDAISFTLGRLKEVQITVNGTVRTLRTPEWIGGAFTAVEIRTFSVTGGQGFDGDFSADLTIGGQGVNIAMRRLFIAGDASNFNFNADGDVRVVVIRGSVTDSNMDSVDDTQSITFGSVRDSEINFQGVVGSLQFVDWIGGTLFGFRYETVTATGDGSLGLPGDFFADVDVSSIGSFTLRNGGSFSGSSEMNFIDEFVVGGEVRDSFFTFTANPFAIATTIGLFDVAGGMLNSSIRSAGTVDTIIAPSLTNVGIYIGTPGNLNGLPDTGAGINPSALLRNITIGDNLSNQFNYINSYIVAGRIENATIFHPDTANLGQPFGMAAGSIRFVETWLLGGGRQRATNPPMTLPPLGDYQVRVNFMPPA